MSLTSAYVCLFFIVLSFWSFFVFINTSLPSIYPALYCSLYNSLSWPHCRSLRSAFLSLFPPLTLTTLLPTLSCFYFLFLSLSLYLSISLSPCLVLPFLFQPSWFLRCLHLSDVLRAWHGDQLPILRKHIIVEVCPLQFNAGINETIPKLRKHQACSWVLIQNHIDAVSFYDKAVQAGICISCVWWIILARTDWTTARGNALQLRMSCELSQCTIT